MTKQAKLCVESTWKSARVFNCGRFCFVGREHIISCFVPFAFEETVVQIPLFFTVCSQTTGNDIALFMMEKLVEHGAILEKLVSVTTDGAANVNGKYSGMTVCLRQLLRQQCTISQKPFNDFHSVWCFAHRLNLVTKEFLCLKNVNLVKSFADWFADRRIQMAYKTFLSRANTQRRLKSIPQPSDTRWLFYQEVVSAILSQRLFVEDFVKTQERFPTFWKSLLEKVDCGLLIDGQFSFQNARVCSLFLFVDYVLGILGKVNKFLQQRYLMVWDAWCVVKSLRRHILFVSSRLKGKQPPFTFLSTLDRTQKETFALSIEQLAQSLECRFHCPSQSLVKRMRMDKKVDRTSHDTSQQSQQSRCSIMDVFDILSFKKTTEDGSLASCTNHVGIMAEIERVGDEIKNHPEIVKAHSKTNHLISNAVGFVVEHEVTLQDIFCIVEKERFPLLWNETVKIKTIIPTTVSCEQSFSVMKNARPNTKKTETMFANFTTKFQQR